MACRPLRSLISFTSPGRSSTLAATALFHGQRFEHPVFDGVFGNQIDDRDGLGLVFAPGAGDALFQLGRIPGQVAIDHHAGVLQIKPGRAGIRAEKHAALRVVLEGVDFRAAALLRHAAGMPGVADVALGRTGRAPVRASVPIRKR